MFPDDPYFSGPPVVSAPSQPTARKVNTCATWSLVFAFVFAPVGIVLGHLGLAQIKRTGERGRDRALIGVILSYVLTVVAVVALVWWGIAPAQRSGEPSESSSVTTTTVAPTAPALNRLQLVGLLLDVDGIKRVANAPNNYTAKDVANDINSSDGVIATPPQCSTAVFSGAADMYQPRGVQATVSRSVDMVRPMKAPGVAYVEERVSLFVDAGAASQLLDKMSSVWGGCTGRFTVDPKDGSASSQYDIGAMTHSPSSPSMILLTATPVGQAPIYVLRAAVAKANVVVDVAVIGADLRNSAEAIAAAIENKIQD